MERLGAGGVRGRRGPAGSCRKDPRAWEMSPRKVTTVLPLSHPVSEGKEAG